MMRAAGVVAVLFSFALIAQTEAFLGNVFEFSTLYLNNLRYDETLDAIDTRIPELEELLEAHGINVKEQASEEAKNAHEEELQDDQAKDEEESDSTSEDYKEIDEDFDKFFAETPTTKTEPELKRDEEVLKDQNAQEDIQPINDVQLEEMNKELEKDEEILHVIQIWMSEVYGKLSALTNRLGKLGEVINKNPHCQELHSNMLDYDDAIQNILNSLTKCFLDVANMGENITTIKTEEGIRIRNLHETCQSINKLEEPKMACKIDFALLTTHATNFIDSTSKLQTASVRSNSAFQKFIDLEKSIDEIASNYYKKLELYDAEMLKEKLQKFTKGCHLNKNNDEESPERTTLRNELNEICENWEKSYETWDQFKKENAETSKLFDELNSQRLKILELKLSYDNNNEHLTFWFNGFRHGLSYVDNNEGSSEETNFTEKYKNLHNMFLIWDTYRDAYSGYINNFAALKVLPITVTKINALRSCRDSITKYKNEVKGETVEVMLQNLETATHKFETLTKHRYKVTYHKQLIHILQAIQGDISKDKLLKMQIIHKMLPVLKLLEELSNKGQVLINVNDTLLIEKINNSMESKNKIKISLKEILDINADYEMSASNTWYTHRVAKFPGQSEKLDAGRLKCMKHMFKKIGNYTVDITISSMAQDNKALKNFTLPLYTGIQSWFAWTRNGDILYEILASKDGEWKAWFLNPIREYPTRVAEFVNLIFIDTKSQEANEDVIKKAVKAVSTRYSKLTNIKFETVENNEQSCSVFE